MVRRENKEADMPTRALIAAAGALACLTAPHAALADTELRFDRADLADPAAVEALHDAVERAARSECRKTSSYLTALSPSVRRLAIEECTADTVDAAVRATNAPELAARHERGAAQPSVHVTRR